MPTPSPLPRFLRLSLLLLIRLAAIALLGAAAPPPLRHIPPAPRAGAALAEEKPARLWAEAASPSLPA